MSPCFQQVLNFEAFWTCFGQLFLVLWTGYEQRRGFTQVLHKFCTLGGPPKAHSTLFGKQIKIKINHYITYTKSSSVKRWTMALTVFGRLRSHLTSPHSNLVQRWSLCTRLSTWITALNIDRVIQLKCALLCALPACMTCLLCGCPSSKRTFPAAFKPCFSCLLTFSFQPDTDNEPLTRSTNGHSKAAKSVRHFWKP